MTQANAQERAQERPHAAAPNPLARFQERALLVRLSVTQWTARRKDENATQEVHQKHGAQHDAGAYNKALIAKETLQPVRQAATAIRQWVDEQTLPWQAGGVRILPTTNYDVFMRGFRQRKDAFDVAAGEFCASYGAHKAEAQRRLGGLFDPGDYPDPAKLPALFGITLKVEPFPKVGADWRADIPEQEMQRLRAEAEAEALGTVREAQADAVERLRNAVQHIADKCRLEPDERRCGCADQRHRKHPEKCPDKVTGIFRDSMLGNLRELVNTLPRLNLADDPAFRRVCAEAAMKLGGLDADALRDDPDARAQAQKDADAVLAKMAGFTGMTP